VCDVDILGRPTGGRLSDQNPRGFVLERVTSIPDGRQGSWTRELAARFAAGDVAYVARAEGQPAAWAWVSQAPQVRCPWSGLRFELLPDEAFVHDLWSFPGHRHTGAAAFVMRGLLRDLGERGAATSAFACVPRENRENQALHRLLLGFEQLQVSAVRRGRAA
jgi:hypothetical protein